MWIECSFEQIVGKEKPRARRGSLIVLFWPAFSDEVFLPDKRWSCKESARHNEPREDAHFFCHHKGGHCDCDENETEEENETTQDIKNDFHYRTLIHFFLIVKRFLIIFFDCSNEQIYMRKKPPEGGSLFILRWTRLRSPSRWGHSPPLRCWKYFPYRKRWFHPASHSCEWRGGHRYRNLLWGYRFFPFPTLSHMFLIVNKYFSTVSKYISPAVRLNIPVPCFL